MSDSPYEERLYFLLWATHASATPLADHALAGQEGMTRAMLGMLQHVSSTPGATSADIVRRLPVTQQAVSQLAARLEKRGWIERRLMGGRRVGLYLTPAGDEALEMATASDLHFEAQLKCILGDERYEELRKLLLQANQALSIAVPEGAPPHHPRKKAAKRAAELLTDRPTKNTELK